MTIRHHVLETAERIEAAWARGNPCSSMAPSKTVRNLQAYLHTGSEHWLDWFHITMLQKVAEGIGEFETYIRNNEEFIPNFGER